VSVSNGQNASDVVFNAAFVSKVIDSTSIGKLTLNRSGSGTQVDDVQQDINTAKADIITNAANIATNVTDIATNAADIVVLQGQIKQGKFDATVDPVNTNDTGEGYEVGSFWINITDDRAFIAVDVTGGSAIWKRIDKRSLAVSGFLNLDMSVSNITDAAYVELIADTGADPIKRIQSFYPAGSLAFIAIGAAASEVDNFILTAGGNGEVGIDVDIPANSRLSIKLLSGQTTVSSGVLTMNLFTEV